MIEIKNNKLYKDNKPYQPAGFICDYRTDWASWDKLLNQMKDSDLNIIRFNMGVTARDGGLCLHDSVSPGHINQLSMNNLKKLVKLITDANLDYWINWLHRGGAGRTVPMDWTDFPEEFNKAWAVSPWNINNGGIVSHPMYVFKKQYDSYWTSSLKAIFDQFGNDPHFVHFTLCTEGYLFSGFSEVRAEFLDWQDRMIRYIKNHPKYNGQIISTGDGTVTVKGRKAVHSVPSAMAYITHIHPKGEAKPRITSIYGSGRWDGFYNHTSHSMMGHHTNDKPYWCGAMGYGQMLSRLQGDEFGRARTDWDLHANKEHCFTNAENSVGCGMNWDHEGYVHQYNASDLYSPFIKWFRSNTTKDNEYIDFISDIEINGNIIVLKLVSSDKLLYYAYDANQLPNLGTGSVSISTPWGFDKTVPFGYGSIDKVTEPVTPQPDPKPRNWRFNIFDYFRKNNRFF